MVRGGDYAFRLFDFGFFRAHRGGFFQIFGKSVIRPENRNSGGAKILFFVEFCFGMVFNDLSRRTGEGTAIGCVWF